MKRSVTVKGHKHEVSVTTVGGTASLIAIEGELIMFGTTSPGYHRLTRAQARKFFEAGLKLLDATEPEPRRVQVGSKGGCWIPDYSGAPSADLCDFKHGHRGPHSWERACKGTGRKKG